MDKSSSGDEEESETGYQSPDHSNMPTTPTDSPEANNLQSFNSSQEQLDSCTNDTRADKECEEHSSDTHVGLDNSFASAGQSSPPPDKCLDETQPMRNAVVTDSEGDFILEEDLNHHWKGMLSKLFGDVPLPQDDGQPSLESKPSAVSFPSHISTSTNNLIPANDNLRSCCELGKFDYTTDDEELSRYSESVASKVSNGTQEFVVYAEGNEPRNSYPKRSSGGRKVLFVENKPEDDIWEKFEFHWRALEKRINRNNHDAIQVLKKIQSAPNSNSTLDDFEARERYYRRKHLLSWQAAIEMPRSKKIPFETQIPLAATRHLAKRLPKLERLRRRIIKIFACGSNRFYVHEVLTQLSIDNFNAKYSAMKASNILPGFGLQKRMTMFLMKHPKMIERDEIMNYSYGDYIQDNQHIHSHRYFTDGGTTPSRI